MRNLLIALSALALTVMPAAASMTIPPNLVIANQKNRSAFSSKRRSHRAVTMANARTPLAMAIPGYGVGEQVFVGGFSTFLSIFNNVITARILLSWFPQAQSIGILQPVFAITDPYLNLFRGIIPPVFGLDLSPLLAFFTLSVLGNATAAVGCEIPAEMRKKLDARKIKGFTFGHRQSKN